VTAQREALPALEAAPGPETTGLRASMNWLHTWCGVVMGALLFIIFWMGTLSVFDREIDRWMMPASRLPPASFRSLDGLQATADRLVPGADEWLAMMDTDREPIIRFTVFDRRKHVSVTRDVDPTSGRLLDEPHTLGATGFFFEFHRALRLGFMNIGRWIVGLAGMTMLVLCITGVIFHKKLFSDFFTLRVVSKPARTTLDLHVLAGVLGLPFNFLMPLVSVVIYWSFLMPTTHAIVYQGDIRAFIKDIDGSYTRPASDKPGQLASIDAMAREALRRWDGTPILSVSVVHPHDAAAFVVIRRSFAHGITVLLDEICFDGTSGQVLETIKARPIYNFLRFVSGMHIAYFKNWTLRWFYYLSGLLGCVMVATGLLFWVHSRRKMHAKLGLRGTAIVECLAVASITGTIVSTLAFLVANRALPSDWPGRQGMEVWAFYAVWILCFAHAWSRPRLAWAEQCWLIAAGGILAVILNALTTGMPIPRALAHGQFAVAGVDSVMLLGALISAAVAVRLGRRTIPASSPSVKLEHQRA
jgi:uncharacterized iron-regulated membrane protein